MINMRRAFTQHTTLTCQISYFAEGSYDEDNIWQEGVMTRPMPFACTATPTGSADEGSYGDRMEALPEGEREKKFMQFTAGIEMPMKSIIHVYNDKYKVTRIGNYSGAGFYTVVGECVSDKAHWL